MKKFPLLLCFFLVSCGKFDKNISNFSDNNIISEDIIIEDFGNIINDYEYYALNFYKINDLIIPDIVYADLYIYNNHTTKTKVEVLEDYKNGTKYHVKNKDIDLWVNASRLEFNYEDNNYPLSALSFFENEIYVNYQKFSSDTNYFVWVDLKRQVVNIFLKLNDYLFQIKSIKCASGKMTTPTKRGFFTIISKGPVFYNEEKYYKCYYWAKFSDNYLFHSLPYSYDEMLLTSTLQKKVSHGCIRMTYQDAKWFYDSIPLNTAVWIN